MRATILAWVACLCVTGATSLRAQQSRPERIGSRVRVTVLPEDSTVGSRVLVGELVAIGDSALLIRPREATVEESVPTSRIQRFEVRTGKNRGEGAKLGALVGLVSGLAIGVALGDDCSSTDFICFDRSETGAGGALIGLGLGTWIGLIAGRGDRWKVEAVPARVTVVPASEGGVRLGATFRF